MAVRRVLIDRYGGVSSLVLLESGEGAAGGRYHQWSAFDGAPGAVAKLHIEWALSGTELLVVEPVIYGDTPAALLAALRSRAPEAVTRLRRRRASAGRTAGGRGTLRTSVNYDSKSQNSILPLEIL